jgi:GxxExxY protein
VYHKAFEVALRLAHISYQSEVITCILYKGHNVGFTRIDLLLHYNNKDFIIELKAVNNFNGDTANTQILSYLRQRSCNEGMIINFGQLSKNESKLNFRYFSNNGTEYDIYNYTNNGFVKQVNNIINIS